MTNRSESIAELTKALSKAQGQMGGAIKDSKNPFFHSTYADLASVWDACRKPLSDNGLAIIQLPGRIAEDRICVETILSHSSGEWISCCPDATPIATVRKDKTHSAAQGGPDPKEIIKGPQPFGQVTTYLRRYGLAAMVGIAQVDDDGEAAMGRATKANKECLTADQIDQLIKLMEEEGIDEDNIKKWLKRLATRFAVNDHSQIYKENFAKAKEVIVSALVAHKDKSGV